MATGTLALIPDHLAHHYADPIFTENLETMWLPGHVKDKNERRRQITPTEVGYHLTFLEACKAAQDYEFVMMFLCPDAGLCVWPEEHGHCWGAMWHEIDPESEIEGTVMPWTRINLR